MNPIKYNHKNYERFHRVQKMEPIYMECTLKGPGSTSRRPLWKNLYQESLCHKLPSYTSFPWRTTNLTPINTRCPCIRPVSTLINIFNQIIVLVLYQPLVTQQISSLRSSAQLKSLPIFGPSMEQLSLLN